MITNSNTEDKIKSTEEIIEDLNVLMKLQTALKRAAAIYKGSPDNTGVKPLESGGYEVSIDKGPTIWFKDEYELGDWILRMNQNE